jgi:hypothetical protein
MKPIRSRERAVRRLAAASAVMLLGLLPAAPALACSCLPPGDIVDEAARSSAVFSGEITTRKGPRSDGDGPFMARLKRLFGIEAHAGHEYYVYEFLVGESFKGGNTRTRSIATATSSAACGYSFAPAKTYLVFATEQDGRLHTGLCSATAEASQHGAAIERLRQAMQGP